MPKPLVVDLPVCPKCSHVSKVPAGLFSGEHFCGGPKKAPHKRERMQTRTFVEAQAESEAVAA